MAEILNFKRARKRKARSDAGAKAAENRARFGRTKAQKQRDEMESELARRKLDALRREKDPPGE